MYIDDDDSPVRVVIVVVHFPTATGNMSVPVGEMWEDSTTNSWMARDDVECLGDALKIGESSLFAVLQRDIKSRLVMSFGCESGP